MGDQGSKTGKLSSLSPVIPNQKKDFKSLLAQLIINMQQETNETPVQPSEAATEQQTEQSIVAISEAALGEIIGEHMDDPPNN
jgi:hypothetical protein